MINIEQTIPHIPSKNMGKTIDFMVIVFGFKSSSYIEHYSELSLGNNVLGILASEGEPNQQSIYLKVSDVDIWWANAKSKLKNIETKTPFDQAYGMREVHLVIPETNTLLFIGSKLKHLYTWQKIRESLYIARWNVISQPNITLELIGIKPYALPLAR